MTEDEKKLEAAEFQRIQDKYAADAHFGYQKLRTMPDINLKNGLPQDAYTNQPHPVRWNCACVKCVAARDTTAPIAEADQGANAQQQVPAKRSPGRPPKKSAVQPEPEPEPEPQGAAS